MKPRALKDTFKHFVLTANYQEDHSYRPGDYQVKMTNLKILNVKVFIKTKSYTQFTLKRKCFPLPSLTQTYYLIQTFKFKKIIKGRKTLHAFLVGVTETVNPTFKTY
jgi:hypothetical protein